MAVLGASNYTYAEARWTQSLPDWIGCHVGAFASFGGAAQPAGGALGPGLAVGDHGAGAGDQHAGVAAGIGQVFALEHPHHPRFAARQAGGDADPVAKTTVAAKARDRIAGFKDEEGFHQGAGKAVAQAAAILACFGQG